MSKPKQNDTNVREYLIIMRYLSGDEEAFEELYSMHKEGTLRYLNSMVNGKIAEDLQQEVWLKVYTSLKDLLNLESFKAWLYRITRFEALDHIRKRQAASQRLLAYENDLTTEEEFEEIDQKHVEYVKGALEELPDHQREVIILNYLEGLTYKEIALIIGVPSGTVRSRAYHAKQTLKKIIESKR